MRLIVGAVLMIGLALRGAAAQGRIGLRLLRRQEASSAVAFLSRITKQGQKTEQGLPSARMGQSRQPHHVMENASKVFGRTVHSRENGFPRQPNFFAFG